MLHAVILHYYIPLGPGTDEYSVWPLDYFAFGFIFDQWCIINILYNI